MILQETIDKVYDELDVVAIVGQHVALKKAGANFIGCCPFHNEKSPSFTVSPSKGIYKCFGCGASGGAVNFLMELKKLSYPDAIKDLAKEYNIEVKYDQKVDAEAADKREQMLKVLAATNRQYKEQMMSLQYGHELIPYILDCRAISPDSVLQWELGYAPDDNKFITSKVVNKGFFEPAEQVGVVKSKGGHNYDFFRDRLMFPIHHERTGRVIGFGGRIWHENYAKDKKPAKYLNTSGSDVYNKSATLYGLYFAQHAIRTSGQAILVEGYTDVISMHQNGFENTVASCGTAFTLDQAKKLRKYAKELVILRDGDSAGMKATMKDIDIALEAGFKVKVVVMPEGDDPDEILKGAGSGSNRMQELLDDGEDAIMWKATTVMDGVDDPNEKGEAVAEVVEMLSRMKNVLVREEYVKMLYKPLGVAKKLLQTDVTVAVDRMTVSENRDVEHFDTFLPEGVDEEEYHKFGFYEYNNEYYFATAKSGATRGSNFVIRSLFLVRGSDSKRVIEIKNYYGHKEVLIVDMDDFTSISRMKRRVEGMGNFVVEFTDAQLQRLKRKLLLDEGNAKQVGSLGYLADAGTYTFANGMYKDGTFYPIDDNGMVTLDGDMWFIPALGKVDLGDNQNFDQNKKFIHKPTDTKFTEWADLMMKVHGDHAFVGITFFCASIFRDVIFGRLNFFPHLFLFGEPGTGKSELARSIISLFGIRQDLFNLNTGTEVAFFRFLARFDNSVVWFDEYSNDIHPKTVQALKNAYDGAGREKGVKSNDNQTSTTKISSAAVISGQYQPVADEALFTRVCYEEFGPREFNEHAFNLLNKVQDEGLTNVLLEVFDMRDEVERKFDRYFDNSLNTIKDQLQKKHNGTKVMDRVMKNYAICIAIFRCLATKLVFPFSEDEIVQHVVAKMVHHTDLMGSTNSLSQFWDMVNYLASDGQITEGKDYDLRSEVSEGKEHVILSINLARVYPLYSKNVRQALGYSSLDKGSLIHYLRKSTAYFEYKETFRFGNTRTSAFRFKYNDIKDLSLLKDDDDIRTSQTGFESF